MTTPYTNLPATLERYAGSIVAASSDRSSTTWLLRFDNGYGARVTRDADGDWYFDIVLADGTTVPFLPHRQRLSQYQVAHGLVILSTAPPAPTRTLRESIAVIESIPALAPLAPYARYLRAVRWFPLYAELVFQVGDVVADVCWVFDDARLNVSFDVCTLALHRDGTDPNVPSVDNVSTLTVSQVARAIGGLV